MKIHSCMQGSTEWLQLRAGIPTASQFDLILTKSGKPSQSAERYLLTLLAERLMGHPITEHISMWMNRGSQLEQDAVDFYHLQRDMDTVPVGFITNDPHTESIGRIGASPDRLVGEDGLLEIKVPSEYIHMAYLLKYGSPYAAYKVQVQGQLWITGRRWVDVLSWHPELPPALARIERDDDFIQLLSVAVSAFSEQLELQWAECQKRQWVIPCATAEKSASEILKDALIASQKTRHTDSAAVRNGAGRLGEGLSPAAGERTI